MKKASTPAREPITVSDTFCFTSNLPRSIRASVAALENFTRNFENVVSLKGDMPIFLDTNILLSYYGMAASEKEKLIRFFLQNKSKLHLTNQVQNEYLGNREKIIATELFAPLNNLANDLENACTRVTNEFSTQLNKSKRILSKDYPEVWNKLQKAQVGLPKVLEAEGALKELRDLLSATTRDYKDISFSDDLLRACAQLNILDPLSSEEIAYIEKLFDQLIDQQKLASDEKRPFPPFPGQGDIRGKDYPYGDFIIFHEILKFMKQHDRDAIFLTNEKSKGDWMGADRNPHTHYIELAHALTGKMLFILHAEGPLKLSMENIHGKVNFDPTVVRESPVLNIYHAKHFGFVYGRPNEEGLFFHKSSFINPVEFDHLQNQEYLRFRIGDREGRPYILEAQPVSYDLIRDQASVKSGTIASLGKRYGGVNSGDDNLVFNAVAVDKGDDFRLYKIGDEVEFLQGLNIEGEPIIRKIRRRSAAAG
jgi:predicted nucleic acid-binding protein